MFVACRRVLRVGLSIRGLAHNTNVRKMVSGTSMKYPEVRREEEYIEVQHGVSVKDPYRWLEDSSHAPELQVDLLQEAVILVY